VIITAVKSDFRNHSLFLFIFPLTSLYITQTLLLPPNMASLLHSVIIYAPDLGPYVILITIFFYFIFNYFRRGLHKYPGPFLAKLTDWWRFVVVLQRRPETTHINLHRRYGDIVRLGPNMLSFADPRAVRTIYGLNKGFVKVPETSWSRSSTFC
jgi:hypothetical protein